MSRASQSSTSGARALVDPFTLAILCTVGVASVLPSRGETARGFALATTVTITALFFSHGARLSREAVRSGILHFRLHALVLGSTFVMFPLLGLLLQRLAGPLLPPPLDRGFLYLCIVPSTVQSSIALTALARGNVAAAVCSASLSSLVGIVATPLLARLLGLTNAGTTNSLDAVTRIAAELLLPFALGQALRPRIATWVERQGRRWRWLDQGSILLVVYTAFSAATVEGLWSRVPLGTLLGLVPLALLLLAAALSLTWLSSRLFGFAREEQVVAVFCGAKKSLASGVPLANVLFPASAVGATVLPLMLFHQLELMVGAVLAQRWAERANAETQATNRSLV